MVDDPRSLTGTVGPSSWRELLAVLMTLRMEAVARYRSRLVGPSPAVTSGDLFGDQPDRAGFGAADDGGAVGMLWWGCCADSERRSRGDARRGWIVVRLDVGHVSVGRVALAVCLLFDRRSERAVRALWDRLERAGVPSLRSHTHGRHVPHVSYAVLRTWDLAAVSAAVAGLGPVAPVELTFDGVGLFRRGRAWLLAGAAAEFVARQERVVEAAIEAGADLHEHYRPGRWLPHCSVAPRASLAQLPVLAAAIYDVLPLAARLDRVALIDSATGEVWPVLAVQ